jgi:uncharacterized protein (DUF1697 family)
MTSYLALLRAVNVGGSTKIGMADLRALLGELGLAQPRSLLQSGNLLFRAEGTTPDELEALLAAETGRRLGLATDFFVRTADEWDAVVAGNPFPAEAKDDPGHLVVMALKAAPEAAAVAALQASIAGRETVRAVGRQAYLVYPDGIGESKLTIQKIEKALGTRGTGRNWNTTLKLQARVRE